MDCTTTIPKKPTFSFVETYMITVATVAKLGLLMHVVVIHIWLQSLSPKVEGIVQVVMVNDRCSKTAMLGEVTNI